MCFFRNYFASLDKLMNLHHKVQSTVPLTAAKSKIELMQLVNELNFFLGGKIADKILEVVVNQTYPFNKIHIVNGIDKNEENLKNFLDVHNNTSNGSYTPVTLLCWHGRGRGQQIMRPLSP